MSKCSGHSVRRAAKPRQHVVAERVPVGQPRRRAGIDVQRLVAQGGRHQLGDDRPCRLRLASGARRSSPPARCTSSVPSTRTWCTAPRCSNSGVPKPPGVGLPERSRSRACVLARRSARRRGAAPRPSPGKPRGERPWHRVLGGSRSRSDSPHPTRALVAVGGDAAVVLEEPGGVQQVPGHERGVAVREVVVRPSARGRGRTGGDGLADPAGVGLRGIRYPGAAGSRGCSSRSA